MAVARQKLYNPSVLGVNHLHKPVHDHSNTVLWKKGGPGGFCPDTEGANQACQLDGDWLVWESHLSPLSFRVIFASRGLKHLGCTFQDFLWGLKNLNNERTPRKLI